MEPRAIILAAGKSRRLGGLTEALPKCLLPLGGRTILDHQLENLRAGGIADITLVTGFCDALVRRHCPAGVAFVENPVYDRTNSIYSLWLALRQRRGSVVVLNSDVVFHPGILQRLLASPRPDALSVCLQDGMGEEEMKVRVEDGRIVDICKDMDPADAHGENVGVVKFSAAGAEVLFEYLNRLVAGGTVNAWAPLAFQRMCCEYPLFAIGTDGLPWIEIDFPEDYEVACCQVYPRICAGEELRPRPPAR